MAVRVLLVEDEGIIRVVTAEALEDAGFEVVEARDSDQAIERLADSAPFDAIFTDVQMPGRFDGIALAAHVRRLYPDIPVLVASGDCGNISTRIAALRPPATFFSKPYIADEVVGALKRVTSPT